MKKKRIISLLLALLMGLGMFPSAAFATEAAPCAVCGAPDCAEEHVQCTTCGEYDCTVDHAAAPAEEPVVCPVCNTENCTAEHVYCAVCADYDCGLDHEAELCPVCKAADCEMEHVQCATCGEYDCTVDHTAAPAQPPAAPTVDYSGDVGMYATVNPYFAEGYVEVFDGSQIYNLPYTDFAEGLVLTVADWHYDAGTGYLWYQVYVTVGQLPAAMADGWWIHQATAADNAEEKTLILTSPLATADETGGDTAIPGDGTTEGGDTATSPDDAAVTEPVICPICSAENCTQHVPCEICGEYDCTTQHSQCEICGAYDCTAQHVYCELCQKYDCGISHVWCDICQKYDCGISHVWCDSCQQYDCTQHLPCQVCGVYNCGITHVQCGICGTYDCTTQHTYCELCNDYDCGIDHTADIAARYSGAVGKYARIIEYTDIYSFTVCDGTDFSFDNSLPINFDEIQENSIFKITDWTYYAGTTAVWYKVEFVSGGPTEAVAEFWPAEAWIFYDYADPDEEPCPALEFVDVSFCPTCGQLNCTMSHFYCEVCNSYSCTATHLYCNACNVYDCPLEHTFCYTHNKYDCTETHQTVDKPLTAPIVTAPSGSSGDVTIADRYGNVVNSLVLSGMRDTLSAWGAYADYQWQVCYDAANDLWADIQGQSAQGIVLSPAMFLGAFSGEAYLRCRSGSGDAATYSAPVAVSFADPATETFRDTVGDMLSQADEGTGNLSKTYVTVQYLYDGGETAAAPVISEIIPGSAFNHSYTYPAIPGYAPNLDAHSYTAQQVQETTDGISLNFDAGVLTEGATFTVRYYPAPVEYTVVHYYQNTFNDEYSRGEVEVFPPVTGGIKTGDIIQNVHKDVTGFYHLNYETPAAAADGSTVVNVYYDRYYYLMTFDLGTNGYGTDPIYARYGSDIKVPTPTREGYTFVGWGVDDGNDNVVPATVPATMPAERTDFIAIWQANETAKVTVIIMGENAADDEYSYDHTVEIYAKPGETISWDTLQYKCGYTAHEHDSNCAVSCPLQEHEHTLANNCYTLTCTQSGHNHDNCTLACKHTHTISCYSGSGGMREADYGWWIEDQIGDSPIEGMVYTVYGTQYIKFDGTWYTPQQYGGNITLACSHDHNDDCYTCGQAATTHVHSIENNCYTLTCQIPAHEHTASCYACGMSEHTHTSSCNANTSSEMDPDLWTFVSSDEVEVNADGTTVMYVYYDRTQFTLTFHYNRNYSGNYQSTKTITDKWGADIGERFVAINNTAKGNLWSTSTGGGEPWTSFLQIMPQHNQDYYCRYTSTNAQTAEYYTENLDGQYKLQYSVTAYYSDTLSISKEDFYDMEGFTYDHGEDGDGNSMPSKGSYGDFAGAKFYYTRNKYAIEFYSPTELLSKVENIPYETPLNQYNWTPENTQAPAIYEPGTVEFDGWYVDPECNEPFVFIDEETKEEAKMPLASENGETALALYAKWKPVKHTVNFYLSEESILNGLGTIPEEMAAAVDNAIKNGVITEAERPVDVYTNIFSQIIIDHGEKLPATVKDPGVSEGYKKIHPYEGYQFEGWFYRDEYRNKIAFDPENVPVDRDLNLFGEWRSDIVCKYNIYFALDTNGDGQPDTDENGIIYIADPVSGYGLAKKSYTFTAKGDQQLYEGYRDSYFPFADSHTILLNPADVDGLKENSYTFLYRKTDPVPYTVKYLEEGTNKVLAAEKTVSNNTKAVITENFVPVGGYMPDAYQKTLVVVPGKANEIIFWYTIDTVHSIYVVNHYVQRLNADNEHAGWTNYVSLQNTGDIGKAYTEEALSIDGYTLSASYTDNYNTVQKKNGASENDLPEGSVINTLDGQNLTGTLGGNGMELNFYYTKNYYPYEFRYMLWGTATELADPEFGIAPYDTFVYGNAKEIVMDLDNDGVNEDYRLYYPDEKTKVIDIVVDGNPIAPGGEAVEGQAKLNVATFYYVRCTQTMTITKTVTGEGADKDRLFDISLLIHATSGFHQASYSYTKSDNTTGTLIPTAEKTLEFQLKDGQTITINGLPTAEYTVSEKNIPLGYYASYTPAQRNTLTVDDELELTVTNTYEPAALEISKTVEVIRRNVLDVSDFEITVQFPDGTPDGSYSYTVSGVEGTQTAEVKDGKTTISLQNGQTARFPNLPVGDYTVTEKDYSAKGYISNVSVNSAAHKPTNVANVTLEKASTKTVNYLNQFQVGDLKIEKTVIKEFAKTPFNGDTFTFTVERTTDGMPLPEGNSYDVVDDAGNSIGTPATVDENGKLTVNIVFAAEETAHTYTIKGLPGGTYKVTEAEDKDYRQGTREIPNIVVPAENTPVAGFENELIRPLSSLSLKKLMVEAEGYDGELPTNVSFDFAIELTEQVPASVEVTVTQNGTPKTVEMVNGKISLSLTAGETVVVEGLPIGTYKVTELDLPTGFDAPNYGSGQTQDVVVGKQTAFEVTNIFNPAALEVSKTVNVVEIGTNTPEVSKFEVSIQFPEGVTPAASYAYFLNDVAADEPANVTDGKMVVTLEKGDKVRFPNLPTGAYTVTEADYSADGYKSNVSVNDGTYTESRTATATLANGSTQTVNFTNKFPVGDLVIEKTVTKEFYNTPWAGDTFTFTVERTTADRPLKAGNVYDVYEGDTKIVTATVVRDNVTGNNTLTVEIEFDANDATTLETKGASAVHAYTIKNLPAGTYSVVESVDAGYEQSASGPEDAEVSAPSVTGIEIPAETAEAKFTNKLIRPTGKMDLKKLLNAASGFNENELPEDAFFNFTIRLTEDAPDEVTVSKTLNGETEPVTMAKGEFEVSMKANETVSFEGLPIGVYHVIEHSQPSYANTFEIRNEDGNLVRQDATAENGNLYTEIEVKADVKAEVHCVNIYPVERGELMIQKDFTKEYDRDELPANLSSDFKISFEEQDAAEYYYTVYEEDRRIAVDEYGNQLIDQIAAVTKETADGDTDYYITINLKDGQSAVITGGKAHNDGKDLTGVPVCGFTVTETRISSADTDIGFDDFNVSYEMYRTDVASPAAEGDEVPAQLSGTGTIMSDSILAGYTHNVIFTNEYKQQLTDLTITKTGAAGTDENQSFIFTVNGPEGTGVTDLKVVINGNNSVTIRDLPIGTYTVTEDSSWSWRYTPDEYQKTITLEPDATKNTLTFNNERSQPYWLSGDSVNENQFTVNNPTTTN